jgi:hypothetical protein
MHMLPPPPPPSQLRVISRGQNRNQLTVFLKYIQYVLLYFKQQEDLFKAQ